MLPMIKKPLGVLVYKKRNYVGLTKYISDKMSFQPNTHGSEKYS